MVGLAEPAEQLVVELLRFGDPHPVAVPSSAVVLDLADPRVGKGTGLEFTCRPAGTSATQGAIRNYDDNVTRVTNVRSVWRMEPVTSQHPSVGNTRAVAWKPAVP